MQDSHDSSYQHNHVTDDECDTICLATSLISTESNVANNLEDSSLQTTPENDNVEHSTNNLLTEQGKEHTHQLVQQNQLETTILNEINLTSQKGSCDSSNVTFETSNIPRWKKKYACPFCHKLIVGQLPRHIITVHREHQDVQKLNNTSKGN